AQSGEGAVEGHPVAEPLAVDQRPVDVEDHRRRGRIHAAHPAPAAGISPSTRRHGCSEVETNEAVRTPLGPACGRARSDPPVTEVATNTQSPSATRSSRPSVTPGRAAFSPLMLARSRSDWGANR